MLLHKNSSYSRRHRVVVSGLELHTGEFSFLFLSSSSFLLGRSQGKRHRSNTSQQLLTVCIRHDDVWALPSKLQGHSLEVTLSCSLLDQVSNLQGEQSRCWNELPHQQDSSGFTSQSAFHANPLTGRALRLPRVSPPVRSSSRETIGNILHNQITTTESYAIQISHPCDQLEMRSGRQSTSRILWSSGLSLLPRAPSPRWSR